MTAKKLPELHGLEKPALRKIALNLGHDFHEVAVLYDSIGRNFDHTISLCKMAKSRGLELKSLDVSFFQTMDRRKKGE